METGHWRIKKRTILICAAVLALLCVVYWTLIPAVMARYYLSDLDKELQSTRAALGKVAGTTTLPLFTDPDTSLPDRQRQIGRSHAEISSARSALDNLGNVSQLSSVPGGGLGGDYRAAEVTQSRVKAVLSQAGRLLDQYTQLLAYIETYTALQAKLDRHLNSINNVQDFSSLDGRGQGLTAVAQLIRADAKKLESLAAPLDFAGLQQAAAATFQRSAEGFERLETGLQLFSDFRIYGAVSEIEAAALKNQVSDKNLLVTLADKSPTLRQLAELPEKVEHAQSRPPAN